MTRVLVVDELLARTRAVTRRTTPSASAATTVLIGRWHVNLAGKVITAADGTGQVRLTPTEWHLLTEPGMGYRLLLAGSAERTH